MSQEILYTSAAAGLKRGSHGFCTVLSTDGMAGNIAEKLEALSGYRHAFPLHDPRSARNPINYSHLTIQMGGRRYHVLSRIAAAGLDYTQRNNKIAHHVALDESERVSAGPAALLATPQFCKTEWDGTPRIIPRRQAPVNPPEDTGPCQAWNEATGDAGWAGVIAEHLLSEREKPISIIFPLGMDALRLTTEVLSLLPVDRRWGVTFSTYFTKLPAGLQCQLRFVLDGTQEAKALRRHPHVTLVDLAAKLGPAQGGALVEAARIVRRSAPPPVEHDAPPPPPRPNLPEPDRSEPADSSADVSQSTKPAKPGSYALSMPGSRPPGARPPRKPGRLPVRARRKKPWLRRAALILIPLLLLALLGTGGYFYFAPYQKGSPSDAGQPVAANDPAASGKGGSVAPHQPGSLTVISTNNGQKVSTGSRKTPGKPAGTDTTPKEHRPAPPVVAKRPADHSTSNPPNRNGGKPRKSHSPKKQTQDPFADLPDPLNLPKAQLGHHLPSGTQQTKKRDSGKPLGAIHLLAGQTLRLEIVQSPREGDLLGLKGKSFKVKPAGKRAWNVVLKQSGPTSRLKPPFPVGQFTLVNSKLQYTWDESITNRKDDRVVRYMQLRLSIGGKPVTRALTDSKPAKPVPLKDYWKPHSPFEIPIVVPSALPVSDKVRQHLHLEVWVTGLKGGSSQTTQDHPLKVAWDKEEVTLYSFEMKQLPLPGGAPGSSAQAVTFKDPKLRPFVRLVAVFKNGRNGLALHLRRPAQAVIVETNTNTPLPPNRQVSIESSSDLTSLSKKGPDLSVFQWPQGKRAEVFRKHITRLYERLAENKRFDEWLKMYQLNIKHKPLNPRDMIRQFRKHVDMTEVPKAKVKVRKKLIKYLDSLETLTATLARARQIIRSYRTQINFVKNKEKGLNKAIIHYILYLDLGDRSVELVTTEKPPEKKTDKKTAK